jgi:hypothetical protein
MLSKCRGIDSGWFDHTFVVKDGRAFEPNLPAPAEMCARLDSLEDVGRVSAQDVNTGRTLVLARFP